VGELTALPRHLSWNKGDLLQRVRGEVQEGEGEEREGKAGAVREGARVWGNE